MLSIDQTRRIVPTEDYTQTVYPEVRRDELRPGNIVFWRTSGDLRGMQVFKYISIVIHDDASDNLMYAVPLSEPLLLRCGFDMDPTLDRHSKVYRKKNLRFSPEYGWYMAATN